MCVSVCVWCMCVYVCLRSCVITSPSIFIIDQYILNIFIYFVCLIYNLIYNYTNITPTILLPH